MFLGEATSVGIPFEAMRTHTLELARQVSAKGSVSTRLVGRALVNVNTARKTVALARKSVGADTDGLSSVIKLALGLGTAEYVFARMPAIVSEVGRRTVALVVSADGVTGARIVLVALDDLDASNRGVSRRAGGAPAVVTPRSVGAHGGDAALSVGAECLRTLVDVVAADPSVARVSRWAGTGEAAQGVGTERSLSAEAAGSQKSLALVHVFAEAERVAREPGRARAAVAARRVGADGPLAAKARRAVVHVALVHIDAPSANVGWIEGEAHIAHTGRLLAVGLTCGVSTTLHGVAGGHAGFFGVSNEVVRAEAAIGPVVIDALGVGAARRRTHHAFVDVSASALRRRMDFFVARFALAEETALGVDAAGVPSARAPGKTFVSIDTLLLVWRHLVSFPALAEVVDALRIGCTVVVSGALHPDDVSFAGLVGVSSVPLGTLAPVASWTVVTYASDGTRIL